MSKDNKLQETLAKWAEGIETQCRVDSFIDKVEDSKKKLYDSAKESKAVHTSINDRYNNPVTAAGTANPIDSFNNYGFSNDTLNWFLWLALYNDSWIFRKLIDKPAQDQVKAGFVIHGKENYDAVYTEFKKYSTDIINLLQWGALFGGSVAVMLFDGVSDDDLARPMRTDQIKDKRMKLYVTDRWYGVGVINNDTVANMKDIDFGKPKSYSITFADGHNATVHHSWILRYEHRTAPKLVKNGQLQGWGYAEGSHVLNELSRDDQLKAAISTLINKCNIEVIKMAGMRGVFMGTDKGNREQLEKRLEMVQWARNYNSLTFLDKDDMYERHEMSGISGLAQLIETNMWLVAAAVDMPGVLFGELKGGLSENSDANERYADTIMNRCEAYYRPVLYKFIRVLCIKLGIDDSGIEISFNSLVKDTKNEKKMDAMEKYMRVLNSLAEIGVISKYQIAESIIEFIKNGNINITFNDIQLKKLKFEEELSILETYKQRGKDKEIMNSEFGGGVTPDNIGGASSFKSEELNLGEGADAPVVKEEVGEASNGGSEEIKSGGGEES